MQVFYKWLVGILIAIIVLVGGLYIARFIAEVNGDLTLNRFYADHFCAIVGFPIAVYLATVVTAITGLFLLFSHDHEIFVFGFKNVRSVGLATLWLFVFIVVIFAIKFIW